MVDVRDNVEPEVACRRVEESLVDENAKIFDTILVGKATESTEVNWKSLRTEVEIHVVFLNLFSISSLLAKPPIALSVSNGVQTIYLSLKKSL